MLAGQRTGQMLSCAGMAKPVIVVAGAGGFIGGHLVKRLLGENRAAVRAVDVKPLHEWFQPDPHAENLRLDLSLRDACNKAVSGAASPPSMTASTARSG